MLKKNYSKTGNVCRVTFELPKEVNAKKASLCGEFNDWNQEANPMEKRKDGRWSVTISLKTNKDYRFKYLLDNGRWENDWNADGYLSNSLGTEDSLIRV